MLCKHNNTVFICCQSQNVWMYSLWSTACYRHTPLLGLAHLLSHYFSFFCFPFSFLNISLLECVLCNTRGNGLRTDCQSSKVCIGQKSFPVVFWTYHLGRYTARLLMASLWWLPIQPCFTVLIRVGRVQPDRLISMGSRSELTQLILEQFHLTNTHQKWKRNYSSYTEKSQSCFFF